MKYYRTICLSLLLAAKAGTLMAQTPSDTTTVARDSVTVSRDSVAWSQELDGVVIKA